MTANDSTIESSITLYRDTENELTIDPSDLVGLLEKEIKLDNATLSLKVSRSIPRDKFEKNEYFTSLNLQFSGIYELLKHLNGSQEVIKKAFSNAIINRCSRGFDLLRALLSSQQQADGIGIVSFAERTKIN